MKAARPNGKVRRGVEGVTVEDRKIIKKQESPTDGETHKTTTYEPGSTLLYNAPLLFWLGFCLFVCFNENFSFSPYIHTVHSRS